MARLIQPLPSVRNIMDPAVRTAFEAVFANLNAWAGKGRDPAGGADDDHRVPDVAELVSGGVALKNLSGRLTRRPDRARREDITPGRGKEFKILPVVLDASSGLAIGTHSLNVELPVDAVSYAAFYTVAQTFTSATDAATIQLGIASDDPAGLVAAVAISDATNPWDAGHHLGIPVPTTEATWTEITTAKRAIQAVVAVENLTAGKLSMLLFYEVTT